MVVRFAFLMITIAAFVPNAFAGAAQAFGVA